MTNLLRSFEALNIPIPEDECAIEEFMHIDDKNNEVFAQELLNDENELLETMQTTPENAQDESDHANAKACTPFLESTEDSVNFCGFENNMYEKVLEIDQLCPEVQAQVRDE